MQEKVRPFYVFDLDGTLAFIDHRRPYVEAPPCPSCGGVRPNCAGQDWKCPKCKGKGVDPDFKPDWKSFFAACVDDIPFRSTIMTMLQLYHIGCDIEIWSGRSDEVRSETLMWLFNHTRIDLEVLKDMLRMRKAGDYTPDEKLKRKWLNSLNPEKRARLLAVFDDRNKVVNMWRSEGVVCFQVAEGSF